MLSIGCHRIEYIYFNPEEYDKEIYIYKAAFLPSVRGQFLKYGFSHRPGAIGVKL